MYLNLFKYMATNQNHNLTDTCHPPICGVCPEYYNVIPAALQKLNIK